MTLVDGNLLCALKVFCQHSSLRSCGPNQRRGICLPCPSLLMSSGQSDVIFQASNLTLMNTRDYADDSKHLSRAEHHLAGMCSIWFSHLSIKKTERLLMPTLASDTWICLFFLNLFALEAEAGGLLSWWTAGGITRSPNLIIHSFTVKWTARCRRVEMRVLY